MSQTYDNTKPLYDAWGNKFHPELHEVRKGVPTQDKNGRFKFKRKVKKQFAAALGQQELNIGSRV